MFVYIFPGIIVLIISMYLIAIMPRTSHKQQAIPFIGKYFAHRGLHDNDTQAPENSMKAFLRAVEKGYGIELDVQLTKDRIPVVFHDYSLKRVCGVDKKVRDLTFEELRHLTLYQSKERVPKLVEVLKIIEGRVPLIVELKVEWDSVQTCKSTNEVLKKYKGRYCVESFSPFA
jgi:glycerophosphoryl diester phosphodiesterase